MKPFDKRINPKIFIACLFWGSLTIPHAFAQPFVDVISFNRQTMNTRTNNDSFDYKVKNTFAGITLPIRIDSGNYFILRMNGEFLQCRADNRNGISSDASLKMFLLSPGWQHTINKKLSFTWLILPKLAYDFKSKPDGKDFQCGTSLLFQYKTRANFRYKAGVYYNREPFGNFFVPLIGADIQLNERNWIYGQLPLYFRYEHRFLKNLYSGLGCRFFGRSFRLNSGLNRSYVFMQENQVKYFLDYYLPANHVIYAEIGRTLNYGLKRFADNEPRKERMYSPTVFSKLQDGFFFNFGYAYRIRKDF